MCHERRQPMKPLTQQDEDRFKKVLEDMSSRNKFDAPNGRDKSGTYQLQKVNQMHREIIRFIILGYKDVEIAEALGCTTATVRNVKNSELAQRYMKQMQETRDGEATDIATTIKNLAPLALEVSTSIMIDEQQSASVRANISQDLLDRAGYKPVNIGMNLSDKLTPGEIEEIKSRARQNGVKVRSDFEEVEDADFSESNTPAPDEDSSNS